MKILENDVTTCATVQLCAHLELQTASQIFENFENGAKGIIRGQGEDVS
jgi:hypothetical protein